MNANVNYEELQQELDPKEMQGDLLMLLSGRQVTVHTNEEADFDYMEDEDVAFTVKNPNSSEDLLIELCGEFSVFFGTWHGTYKASEAEYARMKQDVSAILGGQAAVLTLYAGGKWLGSVLCHEKPAADADAAALLARPEVLPGMADKVRQLGGRMQLVCWDPAENRSVSVLAGQ